MCKSFSGVTIQQIIFFASFIIWFYFKKYITSTNLNNQISVTVHYVSKEDHLFDLQVSALLDNNIIHG